MLQSMEHLKGYAIQATDGEIGQVQDFYFDAHDWTIRYLVVDTGSWLSGRRVLLSPAVLLQPDETAQTFPVSLNRVQVERSPDIDTTKPVSRQQEAALYAHYNWSPYWEMDTLFSAGSGGLAPVMPMSSVPPIGVREAEVMEKVLLEAASGDPNLHSANTVIGYDVHARDDNVGHVKDFLVDDETWAVQYMIVDTGNWLSGKKVRLAPHWVKTISWTEAAVSVDLQRETVENSPEEDDSSEFSNQEDE